VPLRGSVDAGRVRLVGFDLGADFSGLKKLCPVLPADQEGLAFRGWHRHKLLGGAPASLEIFIGHALRPERALRIFEIHGLPLGLATAAAAGALALDGLADVQGREEDVGIFSELLFLGFPRSDGGLEGLMGSLVATLGGFVPRLSLLEGLVGCPASFGMDRRDDAGRQGGNGGTDVFSEHFNTSKLSRHPTYNKIVPG